MKVVTPAVTQASSAKAAGMNETPPFLLTEFNCGLGMDCADSFFSASLLLGLFFAPSKRVNHCGIYSVISSGFATCKRTTHKTCDKKPLRY